MQARAVLFDLDGTLIESRDYWYAVLCEASTHFGGRPVARAAFDASFGQASCADVEEFFPGTSVAELDAFYNGALPRHAHHVTVVEGAREVLHTLQKASIPSACVTNSPMTFTRAVLDAVGLLPLFQVLACADEVEHPKPAPDLLRLAARRLQVRIEDCVFVGDSRFDVEAGRSAGCRVVGLGIPADETAPSMAEVLALLTSR